MSSDPKFGWIATTFDFEEFENIHIRIQTAKATTQNDFISLEKRELVRLTDDDVCLVRSVTVVGFNCGYVDENICSNIENPKEFAENRYFVLFHSQADDCGIARSP